MMDTTAFIKNGRLYIPVRSVANAMGYGVSATNQNGVVTAFSLITDINHYSAVFQQQNITVIRHRRNPPGSIGPDHILKRNQESIYSCHSDIFIEISDTRIL
ncbi:hypothetical protein SDC9_209877 [bioreactor metagenome]|uniref:Copper amine oxidase-like N-terminal domain-containing protein n=1 Tax=bioreactor metagenome TaxID=1076179 RepID=A0A645JG92_9ZZZZ